MEIIIKQYGKFLLEFAIFIAILVLLFTRVKDDAGNQGIFEIIGAHVDSETIEYNAYTDFDVFASEGEKTSPVITYKTSEQMHMAGNVLSEYISAKSWSGAELAYKVLDITDWNGNSHIDGYDPAMQKILFPKAGMYSLRIKTVDDINQKKIMEIEVPVSSH